MTVENIPWMIQGGLHSAASGRRVLYKATGGAEGIAGIGDLRVHQAAVANGTVLVEPGGAVMVSRYPGVKGQSYDGQVTATEVVAIAPNGGGSTRYDLIIARIDDWNYAGQQATPASLPTDTVPAFKITKIQGVASTVKTAKELNLGYPAIALARVALPAATGSVTDAMITPLREVAVPRRLRNIRTVGVTGGTSDDLDISGEYWPNAVAGSIEIPEWATRARIVAQWFGIKVPSGSTRTGQLWVRLAAGTPSMINTQTSGYDLTGIANASRQAFGAADDVAIPVAIRGTSVGLAAVGSITGGAGGYLGADGLSSCVIDVEFLEAPAEDA
jgi:hypothetical protein